MRLLAAFWFFFCVADGLKIPKRLRYDLECPFLTAEEYEKNVYEGRCPPKSTTRTTSTTPPPLHHGLLSVGSKKKLLKFLYFGKGKMLNIHLSRWSEQTAEVVEGTFIDIYCHMDEEEKTMKRPPKVLWYFNGIPVLSSDFNWRIQSADHDQRLFISPALGTVDSGVFECFVGEEFRGSVDLTVSKLWDALLIGLRNYFICVLMSIPLIVAFAIYRFHYPEEPLVDEVFENEEEEENLDFEEQMLNLKELEKRGDEA